MSTKQDTKKPENTAPLGGIVDLDSDMPEPVTKDYTPKIKLTPVFMQLVTQCLGALPYATMLTNRNNDKIKLIDLIRFIETNAASMLATELEEIITFIANAPFQYVRPLMEIIDNQERHCELWQPVES